MYLQAAVTFLKARHLPLPSRLPISPTSILAPCLTRTLNIQMNSSLPFLLPFTTYLPIKITSCITSEGTSISSWSRSIVLFVGVKMCSPHVVSLGDFFDYGYCYYVSLRSRSRQKDERKMKFNFTARWAAVGLRPPTWCLSVCGFLQRWCFWRPLCFMQLYRDENKGSQFIF